MGHGVIKNNDEAFKLETQAEYCDSEV